MEEIKVVEENEVAETEKKENKVVAFAKKHGKKLAVAAGVLFTACVSYALGAKSQTTGSDFDAYADVVDAENGTVDETE